MVLVVKMATVLEENTTAGQRFDVCFLWTEALNEKDVHKEMLPVYGGKCLLRKAVANSIEKFPQGRSKAADFPIRSPY
jgi:hypothetical protein